MSLKPKTILRQLKQLSQIEPKSEALERALANARAQLAGLAAEPARTLPSNRKGSSFRSKHMFPRIAALVLASAVLVALLVVFILPSGQRQLAFAQVIDKVQQTQSLSFKVKYKRPGSPVEDETRVRVLPNGKMRSDYSKGYSIQDIEAHKMITVRKEIKTVHVLEGFSPPGPSIADLNLYEMIKNIRNEAVERLPDEEIGERKAIVFRVDIKELPKLGKTPVCKVWIDPKTELPIRLEVAGEDESGNPVKSVMYAIEFDQPFDLSFFSFTPPEGYSVQASGIANFPESPDKPELRAPEIIPGVGLGPIRFGMSRDKIESLIGKPDGYEANKTSLPYYSRGFVLSVSHRSGLKNINCISQMLTMNRVRDFAGKTKEGIGLGSSLQEVEKAFGKPDRDEGHDALNKRLVYTKRGLEIQFFEDRVIIINMSEVVPRPDEPSNETIKSLEKKEPIASGNSMRINVVGPDGKPVAGTKIHAAIWAKEKTNTDYVSDAQGQTVIKLPQAFSILRLFTRCDGYVPLFVHWEELDENPPDVFTITLTKGTTIGGFAKNEQGQPIAGAKVEVMLSQDYSEQLKRTSFTRWLAEGDNARITDAEGRWMLDNVPEGDVKMLVKISHPEYIGDKTWGGLQKEQNITLESFRHQKATIVMHRKK
jgi:outer membrane lipoprotein-sorting protein